MGGRIVLELPVLTPVLAVIGNILIGISVLTVFLGLLGVFRFSDFRLRLLSSSKIDTVALLLLLIGVAFRGGISWFSAKALMMVAVVVIANPIVTSQLASRQREDVRGGDIDGE